MLRWNELGRTSGSINLENEDGEIELDVEMMEHHVDTVEGGELDEGGEDGTWPFWRKWHEHHRSD